jgi:hypothetical protein
VRLKNQNEPNLAIASLPGETADRTGIQSTHRLMAEFARRIQIVSRFGKAQEVVYPG